MPRHRVAVVGCGTAGPAAALLLARAGHAVEIYERAPALGPVGAGFLLQPTGLVVLARLGLLEAVLRDGAPVTALRTRTRGGRTLLDLAYADLAPHVAGVGLHRATLLHHLVTAVRSEGVPLHCGAEVTGIAHEADGRWLETRGGGRAGPYDLVLATDGARSPLRAMASRSGWDRAYPWGALWAIVPDPDQRYSGALTQVVDGTRRMVGFLPTGVRADDPGSPPLVSLFWSQRVDDAECWRREGLEAWKSAVRRLAPEAEPILARVETLDALTLATYRDVGVRPLQQGGVVFLGDAAHAMSPQLGQGANLALCDAAGLADALAAETRLAPALERFARERRSQLVFYQRATRWLTPFFQSGLPGLGTLRDLALPLFQSIPWGRGQMLRTMAGLKRGVLRRSYPIPGPAPGGV